MDRIIKAVGDSGQWVLEVLAAPYGGPDNGRDAHGEYFSPNTDFYEKDGAPLPLVAYYHGYTPDGEPQGEPEIIGRTVKRWRDARGLWYRVVLDSTKDLARRVWDAAQKGLARASTGIAGYMGRTNKRTGEITHWLIGELSIWDAEGDRQPANQYAVARPAVKALLKEAGFTLDSQDAAEGEEQARVSEPSHDIHEEDQPIGGNDMPEDTTLLTSNDVAQIVQDALAADRQARDAQEAADKAAREAEEARVKAAVEAERAKWDAEHASDRRLPSDIGAPTVAKFGNIWKYDNLDAGDLGVLIGTLQAGGKRVSEDALKALAIRATQEENEQRMWRARMAMMAEGMPIKANELNQSTLASYGDEWVGVAYSNEMWPRINDEATIFPRIPTIEVPQGSESVTIPIESTPPTFYKVAQASAQDSNTLGKATYTVTSSKMGTGQQSLTVGKLGARTLFTGELEEDSLVPWAAELRRKFEVEAAAILDSLVIDGDTDTSATTNINDIAGTPAGTEYYLVANGFRKLALVTNTANSRSAGTLSIEDFLETLKLMGLAGTNAMDQAQVAFIVDLWTHWKTLELPEVCTRDVFAQPTIENGRLTGLFGYQIHATPNMHRFNADATYGKKANTSGKLDVDTAANNTTGSILAVRWDQWRLGWKRRMQFETQRIPQADATDVVLTMRVGLVYRDTDAAAISYGVTV